MTFIWLSHRNSDKLMLKVAQLQFSKREKTSKISKFAIQNLRANLIETDQVMPHVSLNCDVLIFPGR